MSHRVRRLRAFASTLLAGLFLATAMAGPAAANDGRHRSHRDHRRHDFHQRHHQPSHHQRHHRRHHHRRHRHHRFDAYPVWYGGHHGAHRRGHSYAVTTYYCDLCHHGFGSQRDFYHHLHHHHHIAVVEIPYLIIHTLFGWIYYG